MINPALLQLPALEALTDCLQRRGMAANFERDPICRLAAAYRHLATALPAYGRYTLFEWMQSSLMGALIYRTKFVDMYGSRAEYHMPDGKLHRDGDRPAVESANGTRWWWQNGKQHRDGDRPAVESADGYREWYKNGKQHRDGDRPAVEWAGAYREWYMNGERHRDGDRPAVERANGTRWWWQNGKQHRDGDRPAVEWTDGTRQWWRNGVQYMPTGE